MKDGQGNSEAIVYAVSGEFSAYFMDDFTDVPAVSVCAEVRSSFTMRATDGDEVRKDDVKATFQACDVSGATHGDEVRAVLESLRSSE